MKRISRREFLRRSGTLAAVLSGAGTLLGACTTPAEEPLGAPPSLTTALPPTAAPTLPPPATAVPVKATATPSPPSGNSGGFVPDVEIDLKATERQAQILPGKPTAVWAYEGSLVGGEHASLDTLQDSYLGPLIRVKRGQRVRVRFTHDLPEPSIVHWHGLILPSRMDGHPRRNPVRPGLHLRV